MVVEVVNGLMKTPRNDMSVPRLNNIEKNIKNKKKKY